MKPTLLFTLSLLLSVLAGLTTPAARALDGPARARLTSPDGRLVLVPAR
ncbi:MAG TPA: hypothetical protein VN578_17420 [Candidatus Binatia bacterium]|nr:hypothetical protein [Candidatus Binatia bacterium]